MARLLTTILVLAMAAPALAVPSLTPHTAEYKVKISVLSGKLTTELRRTADGYAAHHLIRPAGISKIITRGKMDVTSEFSSDTAGIKPLRFRSVDTIRDDPDVDLNFDWSTNEVTGTVGEENVSLKLEGMAHDSVSIQYALMLDLLNGGADEHYTLFDLDNLRIANVTNAGSKTVKTGAGTFVALGIRHQKEGSSRITTLWCVEALGFLPVIIEQHRKGELKFRATLNTYTPSRE